MNVPKIKKLSPQEAQKIAAGEVVERPANVVKELIENALDAGATQIIIHLEDGGKKSIRVQDNGCGMAPDDARMAIQQHATSKISSVADLVTIETFGFRGEALASMCAVGKVRISTKQEGALEGIQLTVRDGIIMDERPVACSTGTEILIDDLFYNVPARRKFLKKRDTEFHQIQLIFQAFCLIHTTVSFKLFHDDSLVYNCPGGHNQMTRFTQLWDHHHASHMLTVSHKHQEIRMEGTISSHAVARYDRSHIFVFVNKRWIRTGSLSKAIVKGYMNILPPGRFPAVCLAISIDPREIDVNIHPRKEEVQFMQPRVVEAMITAMITQKFEEQTNERIVSEDGPQVPFMVPALRSYPVLRSFNDLSCEAFLPCEVLTKQRTKQEVESFVKDPLPLPVQESLVPAQSSVLIGQFKKTYLLLENEDGLFLIDQHAAHERILYEQFLYRCQSIATVKLLFAHTIQMTAQDLALLTPYLSLFEQHGIGLEPMSNNQLIVQSLPIHLKNQSIDDIVRLVVGWLHEFQGVSEAELAQRLYEKFRAQMACKAAVKAGDILTREAMEQLLIDLMITRNRFTCPHGRPTGWLLYLHEIEKKFKR
jgi:DNA mismatch repair protein MutL